MLHILNSNEVQHIREKRNNTSHGRWIKFTHFSPQVQTTTKLFKHTKLWNTFRTTKKSNILKTKIPKNNNVHDNSGIYGLTCATCHLNYIAQTGWSLKQPYFEHIQYIRYNNPQSAYTHHILQAHEYEPIQNTMTLIHPASTGCLMDILEQFFI